MTTDTDTTDPRPRRLGGRSHRVVCDVLQAVIAELSRVGYAALRVDDVAVAAHVNKTTIYRRWPTKAGLVAAALKELTNPSPVVPDTGSLASDLRVLLDHVVAFTASHEGRTLTRLFAAEIESSEVEAIARELRHEHMRPWVEVVERAMTRGEIPRGSDGQLIAELVISAAINRFRRRRPLDEGFLAATVNLVVAGAKAGGALNRC